MRSVMLVHKLHLSTSQGDKHEYKQKSFRKKTRNNQ